MAPGRQLCHFLSVGRFLPILDQSNQGCVIRKLEKLDRGVCGGAVIGVERTEERGEYAALRCSYAEGSAGPRCAFPASHAASCLSRKAGDPPTEGFRHSQLGDVWSVVALAQWC